MTYLQDRRGLLSPRLMWLLLAALLSSSCAHALDIKNISLYKPAFISSRVEDIAVGLTASTTTPEEERLVLAIANTLKRDGFKVTYPFFPRKEHLQAVDFTVKLSTSSEFRGSGWNFLINWPGFLIWTPAWHGYNYRVLLGFDADMMDTFTGERLPRLSVPMDLNIRHADMGRTWTEAGGWVGGYTVIAFIGGIVFTRYDEDITPLILDAVERKVSDYVSSKIALVLASAYTQRPPPPPPPTPTEPLAPPASEMAPPAPAPMPATSEVAPPTAPPPSQLPLPQVSVTSPAAPPTEESTSAEVQPAPSQPPASARPSYSLPPPTPSSPPAE